MRVTTADGVDLAVYDFGDVGAGGSGGAGCSSGRPPLLLAHATGFHARTWLPVVEAGLGERFHCYAFDERAHGDSTPPPNGDFSWLRFADDALAVIDALGLAGGGPGGPGGPGGGGAGGGRLRAVGHSCGGALLLLAEMARPGTFESLYCYEPVVMPMESLPSPEEAAELGAQNPLAVGARRRREVFESFDAALANFSSKPPMSAFSPASLRAYVDYGFELTPDSSGVQLKCRGEDEARTYEAAIRHGAYLRLAEVKCPVTLVCGEHTTAFGADILGLVAERLPKASVEVLPGLSHFGPLEDPAAVAASILRAFGADGSPAAKPST